MRLANHYQITFTRPVNTGVYVTSLFGGDAPGFVKGVADADDPSKVNVATYAANGTSAFLQFSIIVSCGP